MTDIASVARASYDAYVQKDRKVIEALIADDFHFTSPLDNHIDRATYFDRCWPNSEKIASFNFVRLVPDGNDVLVTYEGRTTDGQQFQNTEILTIRGSQIVNVEVYFGWSVPHDAPVGGFVDGAKADDSGAERVTTPLSDARSKTTRVNT
jgi:ketosteroid isomerase-like protein